MKEALIPPAARSTNPVEKLTDESNRLYLPQKELHWKTEPRRAGVSSLGVGGTNAHVIVESFDASANKRSARPSNTIPCVVTVTGRTKREWNLAAAELAEWLKANPQANPAAVARTSAQGRIHHHIRKAMVVNQLSDILFELQNQPRPTTAINRPHVVLMFSGEGIITFNCFPIYRRLDIFRAKIDKCAEAIKDIADFDIGGLYLVKPTILVTLQRRSAFRKGLFPPW